MAVNPSMQTQVGVLEKKKNFLPLTGPSSPYPNRYPGSRFVDVSLQNSSTDLP
jgi:hypothetical protein